MVHNEQPVTNDWLQSFVGKGYREGATGPDEWGCWELCVHIVAARGLHVPGNIFGWRKVLRKLEPREKPQRLDIVLFDDPETGVVAHAGTMWDEDNFLHSAKEFGGVVIDRLKRYPAGVRMIVRYRDT